MKDKVMKTYDQESELYDQRRFQSSLGKYVDEIEKNLIIKNLQGKLHHYAKVTQ